MAGERRHHHDPRLGRVEVLLEMEKRAEGRDVGRLLGHRHFAVATITLSMLKGGRWCEIPARGKHFIGGGEAAERWAASSRASR